MELPVPKVVAVARLYNDKKNKDLNPPCKDDVNWIDVNKKLPFFKYCSEALWVKNINGEISQAFRFSLPIFYKHAWIDCYKDDLIDNVTHWMPINESEKENNERL